MIRTNSFAALIGEGAEEELRKRVRRVGRYSRSVKIWTGKSLGVESESGAETAVAVLAVDEGTTLPIVHGLVDWDAGHPVGEFSLIRKRRKDCVAERDVLGTRQLYVGRGKLRGVASDFRFFDSRPDDLIPPGGAYSLQSGSVVPSEPARAVESLPLDRAPARLAEVIDESVRRRVHGFRKVGVAFSGGIDSSALAHCAAKYSDVTLFSVHAKGSKDEAWSWRAAGLLDIELVACPVDADDVSSELKGLALPFEPTPMDRALWCIYSAAGRAARERGIEVMLLGQLADELFGGYMKYSLELQRGGEEATRRMMEEDVRGCSQRGFIRDETACARWVEPRFPFADEEVVELALDLPVGCKISGNERKIVLRHATKELGLPEALTTLPKRAAQYSSGVLKLVR